MENRKIFNIFGEQIYAYYEQSNNKKKVLFIHGFNSTWLMWRDFIKYPRDYDIAMLDLPGCGKSTHHYQISIEYYQKVVAEFVKQIGYEGCLVVTHSLGAASGLYLVNENLAKYAILTSPFNYVSDFFSAGWLYHFMYDVKKPIPMPRMNLKAMTPQAKNILFETCRVMLKKYRFTHLALDQILNYDYTSTTIKELYLKTNKYEMWSGLDDAYIMIDDLRKISKDENIKLIEFANVNHGFWRQIDAMQIQLCLKLIQEKVNELTSE
ncbi:alpha/beta fold hydrolase [[Mycoplasma] gypis]|uniref:Alpha/beta hydrolase n=1 Tax=[Mycoplasma] gypis TaxID=92404 RepID=A0ABZ2RN92_9BACT|nr:alpha/beta hydrolase [[Mycoplasma] gypis]MBN0919326.1 alpha/beta hydrolase [[Mycoplasma] gypis]